MGRNPTVWLYFSWLVSFLRSIEPNSGALIITGNLYGIIAIMSGKWILMAVHSIIYTAFTAFAVYILIHFTALSLFNKNGEYTGLHNGQIAQKLQREYRRLWFMLFHYHPQLVKDGVRYIIFWVRDESDEIEPSQWTRRVMIYGSFNWDLQNEFVCCGWHNVLDYCECEWLLRFPGKRPQVTT